MNPREGIVTVGGGYAVVVGDDGGFSAGDMADARAEGFRQGQAAERTKYVELSAAVVAQNAAYDEMIVAARMDDATWDAAHSRFELARERVMAVLAGARA